MPVGALLACATRAFRVGGGLGGTDTTARRALLAVCNAAGDAESDADGCNTDMPHKLASTPCGIHTLNDVTAEGTRPGTIVYARTAMHVPFGLAGSRRIQSAIGCRVRAKSARKLLHGITC